MRIIATLPRITRREMQAHRVAASFLYDLGEERVILFHSCVSLENRAIHSYEVERLLKADEDEDDLADECEKVIIDLVDVSGTDLAEEIISELKSIYEARGATSRFLRFHVSRSEFYAN